MTPLTDERLDEIEKAVKAATPGPWIKVGMTIVPPEEQQGHWENEPSDWKEWMPNGSYEGMDNDGRYFCAADPTTVLSLIAQARRNRRVEEAMKELDDSIRALKSNELLMDRVHDPTGDIDELNHSAIDVCVLYERLRTTIKETAEAEKGTGVE